MKGTIVIALKEAVQAKYGKDKWERALQAAGIDQEPVIFPTMDVEDRICLKVVDSLCQVLNLSLAQLGALFGDYWVSVYSQRLYGSFYAGVETARDFLLKMDAVHLAMTRNMANASPPRFEYEWKDDRTLIMTYKSRRGLIDFAVGLIEGVGRFYQEKLKVTKMGSDKIEVVFP